MSKAKEFYYRDRENQPLSTRDYVDELEQQNKEQEGIIADLHELKSEKFVTKKKLIGLEQQKAELIKYLNDELECQISICNGIENVDKSLINILNKYKEGE